MVLVGLIVYFYKQQSKDKQRLEDDNKRLMDLLISKNISEFSKLQNPNKQDKPKPLTPAERIKQQMIDEGMYTPGAEHAFEHIVE